MPKEFEPGRSFKQNLVRGLTRRVLPFVSTTAMLLAGAMEAHANPLPQEPTPPSVGCLRGDEIDLTCYLDNNHRVYENTDSESFVTAYGNLALIYGRGSLEAAGFDVRRGQTLALTDYLKGCRRVYPKDCGQSPGGVNLACIYGEGSLESQGLIPPQ